MSPLKFPRQLLLTVIIAALLIAGCGAGATPVPTADVNALSTALVGTTVAQFSGQFTETALAAPSPIPLPTDTPIPLPALPTDTPISFNPSPTSAVSPLPGFTQIVSTSVPAGATVATGDSCNNNVFIQDTTVPDGTVMKPGYDFVKIWRVKNTGTCTWDEGYSLVLVSGDNLDGPTYQIRETKDFVAAGATVDIGIKMTAHLKEGTYTGCWKMKNDQGFYFGTYLCVTIKVVK